jgi:putative transposase
MGILLRRSAARRVFSEATYFNWKKKYEGLLPDEMRRLKLLEDENAKLKKLVADLSLDKAMLQDVLRRKL